MGLAEGNNVKYMTHPKSYWVSIIIFFFIIAFVIVFIPFAMNTNTEIDGQVSTWQRLIGKKQIQDKDNGLEKWQTYRNEEYGFEFDYPVNFGGINKKMVDEFSLVHPKTIKGELVMLNFSNNKSFYVNIIKPQNISELPPISKCNINGLDKNEIKYCENININNQNSYYEIGLEYIPEGSGVNMFKFVEIPLNRDGKIAGRIDFGLIFPEIQEKIDRLYLSGEFDELENIAASYLKVLKEKNSEESVVKLSNQFDQIISSFKFID